jgi:glycosyltransferase involved in cell wall biosynthesis
MARKKLLRITTIAPSLVTLLKGQPAFFMANGFEVWTASAAGPETVTLTQLGIHHYPIRFTRSITPFQDLIALGQLIVLILRFRPDIVHTHTPKAGLLGMVAAWLCRVPVRMHTIAGLPWINYSGFIRWLMKTMEQITYQCSHGVYPNSLKLQEFIVRELNLNQDKVKVIGRGSSNGIDVEFFKRDEHLEVQGTAIRNSLGLSDSEIIFSFVGRVVKDKGIVELLDAFQAVRKVMPCHLFVIGDFEQEPDPVPDHVLQELKRNPHITLTGFVSDIRPWLITSNIFVFPSYREGFPNVVLQAACLELPIIATNINGCNEIMEHEKTGILVPVGDAGALHEAMLKLTSDQKKRKEFGLLGREHVVKNYGQSYVWNELLNEYQAKLSEVS